MRNTDLVMEVEGGETQAESSTSSERFIDIMEEAKRTIPNHPRGLRETFFYIYVLFEQMVAFLGTTTQSLTRLQVPRTFPCRPLHMFIVGAIRVVT